jgi:allophanate hydrolase
VFDEQYISGGSSSGSAVVVALGLVDFAGTDTAGSGRVPAAFNSIIGLKPSRGLLSTRGVVPACRTLDCVSIFARSLEMAKRVFDVARGFDAADPYSRDGALATQPVTRFGVLAPAQREFFGDDEAAALYELALQRFEPRTEIDFTPLHQAAQLLYSGPWVAERLAAIQPFFEQHADEMDPVVREVIGSATHYSAVDAFNAHYALATLKRKVDQMWRIVDALVLPTTPTIYSLAEVAADPFRLNTNLGDYTNFVNLLDMSALAVPAGFRSNGLPFGISLIGPAFADNLLLEQAERYLTP